MDMQMQTMIPTSTAATATAKAGAAGTSGAGAAGEGAFEQLLVAQIVQETPGDAAVTDPAMAGLLMLLSGLSLPIQNLIQNQDGASAEESLPNLLLQAMNKNAAVADALLKDPNLQQWFDQAADLLQALAGRGSQTLSETAGMASPLTGLKGSESMQAQNTLLMLDTMLRQQPNNPVLKHLVEDLQKLIQPLAPVIADRIKKLEGDSAQANSETLVTAQAAVPGEQTKPSSPVKQSAHKHANRDDALNSQDDQTLQIQIVQPVKSKLELLAAKSWLNATVIATTTNTETESGAESIAAPAADLPTSGSPIVHLHELLKQAGNQENAVKTMPQTIYASNFSQEMSQFVSQNMKVTLAGGISEAKLSLFPKNLGHVDVKITMHEGQLVAQFAADTLAGKQMLESQLPQLRQALQSQGLQVEKLEVTQSQSMTSGMFQDNRGQQFSQQQQFQQNSRSRNVQYDQETVEFLQELSGVGQARIAAYGNSFDVTA